ncbi:hypothetical protein [Paraburkholderia sp. BCC1884]|uniref:hypothetical protein n=1 Tax=Paraburkholderia sp. BCC1884 TaxID=2562668 RepID=UPI001183E064|nr:hypothetical protein [Paraburkholderia sp. BCC1884]
MESQVTPVVEVLNTSGLVAEIAGMSPRVLMKKTRQAVENWQESTYELGAYLYAIKEKIDIQEDKNFGYNTFTEYVDAELKVKYAQAMNFVRTYRTLTKNGIAYEKVKALPFSILTAAAKMLTVENVDEVVLKLEGKTYKEVVALPELKASKNQTKAKAGSASAATKKAKAAPAPDYAQDVAFKEVIKAGEKATEAQLVALFKLLPAAKLIKAFNASGKQGVKLVSTKAASPKAKTSPAAA